MSRESVLAMGRQRVEASMSETINAGSYTEHVDDHLHSVRTLVDTHYSGPATVSYPSLTVQEGEAAGQQYSAADIIAKVPVSAPLLPVGDLIIVTDSNADGSLIGREYRVKAAPQSGQVTSHRYPVEEIS